MGRRRAHRDRRRARASSTASRSRSEARRVPPAPRRDASPTSSIPPHEWRTGPCRRRRSSRNRRGRWPSRAAAWPRRGDNMVNGKALFVGESARRATRSRARTRRASSGPNLDEAWQQADKDGLGRSTYEGLVHQQILHPSSDAAGRPADGQAVPAADAREPRDGPGREGRRRLRRAGRGRARARTAAGSRRSGRSSPRRSRRPRTARSPSRPTRAARSPTSSAAPRRPRASSRSTPRTTPSIPHNIALEGDGVDEVGPEVSRRRRRRRSRSTCSPASTRSTAPCPATARAAWRARSPSSRARAGRAAPTGRVESSAGAAFASSRSCCCAACQKK